MSVSNESLRLRVGPELIGARYAFSPLLLLASAPLFILGFTATEVSPATTDLWWAYAVVALLGQLALAAVFAVAATALSFGPTGSSHPWWLVLGVYVVAGQLRVIVLIFGLDLFGLPNDVSYTARVVTSSLLIPLAFGFGSYALAALAQYREAREKLINSLVTATAEMDRQRVAVHSLRQAVLTGVEDEMTEANRETQDALVQLEAHIASGTDVRPELQELLEQSDRRWRRISHDTWNRASISVPRPGLWEVLDVLAKSKPVYLLALALAAIFLFALVLVRALDFWPAVLWTLLWMVAVIPMGWAVNEIGARLSSGETLASLLGLFALLSVGALFLVHPDLGDAAARGAFTIHITNVVTALMIGSAPALLRNQELVLEALQKRLDQSTIDRIRIESELVAVGQQVASRLQANARGEFLVRVLRLQRALDRNDTQGALKAVRALHDSLTHQVLPGEQPGNEELLAFLDNWRGFVDIEHNVSELEVPEGLRAPLNTLVMEAVANAIRHGGARWIRITVAPEGDDWVLTVSNDGEATSEEVHTPGVGANVWDRLTEGHWSLEHDPSGLTTLTARLQP